MRELYLSHQDATVSQDQTRNLLVLNRVLHHKANCPPTLWVMVSVVTQVLHTLMTYDLSH